MIKQLTDYAGGLGRGWPTGIAAFSIVYGVVKLMGVGIYAEEAPPPIVVSAIPDPMLYTAWFIGGAYLVIIPPIRVYLEYRAIRDELQDLGVWDIVVEHAGEGWW